MNQVQACQHVILRAHHDLCHKSDVAEDQDFVQATSHLFLPAHPQKAGYLSAATSLVRKAPQGKHPCWAGRALPVRPLVLGPVGVSLP